MSIVEDRRFLIALTALSALAAAACSTAGETSRDARSDEMAVKSAELALADAGELTGR